MSELAFSREEARHFEAIRGWIFDHTGLHYPERKFSTLLHRLNKLCREMDFSGLKELDEHLQQQKTPNLAVKIACAVSTNHTFFYREEETMGFFRQNIMPTLPAQEAWRIWSAAASSGDEAYSLAIILADELGLTGALEKASILGTDISLTALDQAENGIYSARRLEALPDQFQTQYFRAVGAGNWQVKPEIQRLCTFRRLNLMSKPWPFQKLFHVIFCRNVLYYFDRAGQEELINRLYEVTQPGGWLITSVTESLWGIKSPWKTVKTGIYRKQPHSEQRTKS